MKKKFAIGVAVGVVATIAGAGVLLGIARGLDWLDGFLGRHTFIDNKHVELEEVA